MLFAFCRRMHDRFAVELQADLPNPDPELTEVLQSYIDDINDAMRTCMPMSLPPSESDGALFETYMRQAAAHLRLAKAMLAQCQQRLNSDPSARSCRD